MKMEKQKGADKEAFSEERKNVLALLAKNKNYFGTIKGSKLKAEKSIVNNVYYEQLKCIGYHPNSNDLFATFELKRSTGYSGNLCSKGSREYIRFYVDYGSGWLDQGMVAVNVHDIPTQNDCFQDQDKPLSYTASLQLKDARRSNCDKEVLPKVCAVLSWSIPIPEGDSIYNPIWGNKLVCQIQLKPLFKLPKVELNPDLFIPKFLEAAELNPYLTVSQVTELANANSEVTKALSHFQPAALQLSELACQYKEKGKFKVAPLRFSMTSLLQLKNNPQNLELANQLFSETSGLNLSELFIELEKTKANTKYEELESLGLDYNRNRLAATFRVKLPNGFSGNICNKASKEHIAFWADWDNDCEWTYLGTSSVNSYDLKNLDPKKGACYTAYLPVSQEKLRNGCQQPKIVRIRAVLSWNELPSTTDPEDLNTYGNRLDTHIQLKPRNYPTGLIPYFSILGGIPVSEIHEGTGLTLSDAAFAFNGLPVRESSPFARRVVVQGPLFSGHRYQVQVRKFGDPTWAPLTTSFRVTNNDGISTFHNVGPDNYFKYLTDAENNNNILAWWDTSGDDKWEVKINIKGVDGEFSHPIQLNHTPPLAEINISEAGNAGQGNCQDFAPGQELKGTFVALSEPGYHGHYGLYTNIPGANIQRDPIDLFTRPTAASPGDNWKMSIPANTINCGYYVKVSVVDKTIVNSARTGLVASDTSGFCVR